MNLSPIAESGSVDVNHDGAPDVVTTGWMSKSLYWYENPKKPDTMWERHVITDTVDTEGGWMADINGDGKPDLVLAHYNRGGIFWVDFSGPQPKVHHVWGKSRMAMARALPISTAMAKQTSSRPPAGSKTSTQTMTCGNGIPTGTLAKPASPSSATT